MSVTDPVADALTKIRNAYRAGHMNVFVNHSKIVENVVRILDNENFINSYSLVEREPEKKIYRKLVSINLRYTNSGTPIVKGIERVSKPGRRVYVNAGSVPSVYNNTGIAIISTSRGVMADRDARNAHVGGEFVCKVW